ncbi:MAG: MSHA biogenesis protein MshP [Rubrivivax sp.]
MKRGAARGFGAIAAIVVLVGLSVLAASVIRIGTGSQLASAQDLQAVRATQAARAGTEWGLYQAFKGSWTACATDTSTLDLTTTSGMRVTVTCTGRSHNDGESVPGTPRALRTVVIDAVACNAGGDCPDAAAAARPGYVERRLQVVATGP